MSVQANLMAEGLADETTARMVQPRWSRLWRHRGFLVGLTLMVILVLTALIGPHLVGDPHATDYKNQFAGPSSAHWLGTDNAGRDSLARTVIGAGVSYRAALIVFVLHMVIGITLGVLAGLLGGWVDTVISRVCDVMLGLPSLVIALAIVGALGPGFGNLVLAMSVTGWAGLAKLYRTLSLQARHRLDVVTARLAGVSEWRIAATHVLPGVFSQSLIAATLGLGETILGLAGLSFLGLGVQPPTPEWGSMLNDSKSQLATAPWLLIGPGVGLILTVTSVTLISDALRDCAEFGGVE